MYLYIISTKEVFIPNAEADVALCYKIYHSLNVPTSAVC